MLKLANKEAINTEAIIIELSPNIAVIPAVFAYSLNKSNTLF